MKSIYTFLLFLFISTSSYSQVATFNQFNEPYQYLQSENIPFENFKIGSLQAVISISKVCLKPENHTSKTG